MIGRPAASPHLRDLARLRRVRDRIDREHALPLNAGALARGVNMSAGGQRDTSIVLHSPAATPGVTEDERRVVAEMMTKGTYAAIILATPDLDGTFERLQGSQAEIVQEPTEQPYGVRDCAFRDPAGNLIRIQERR